MSIIRSIRPHDCIFSLLASYGARRTGKLPGSWFVAILEELGVSPSASRQALYRMVCDEVSLDMD